MRTDRQLRAVGADFQTREDGAAPHISGYFSVFGSIYEIAPGMTESFAPGAFADTLSGDIRALVNHDSTLVLGRTKAGTMEIREDSRGLWADVTINTEDRAAMDLYQRVKRGDVDQCSIGFDVLQEDTDYREDGSVHWTIRAVKLYEVSACTFPAYPETNITARAAQRDTETRRRREAWKNRMKGVLKNGTEGTAAGSEHQSEKG